MNTNTLPGSAFRRSLSRVGACAGITALSAALVFGGASAAQAAAPMAGADFYAVTAGSALSVAAGGGVFANDADPEGDAFTIHSVFPSAAVLPGEGFNLGADGSFIYTPPTGYTGTREWGYRIEDATDASEIALVTFTISAAAVVPTAPTAVADAFAVAQDATLTVGAPGVFANDYDSDGDAFGFSSSQWPAGGALAGESFAIFPNGGFTYIAPTGYNGVRVWHYAITGDDGNSAMADVTFTVGTGIPPVVVNAAPAGTADAFDVPQNGSFSLPAPGVLANDSDADGDALSLVSQGLDVLALPGESLTTWADGSLFYTPPTGFLGTRTWWYEVSDGTHTVKTPIVFTVKAVPVGNVAPVANDDVYPISTGAFDTSAPGVLINDTDADGDQLSISVVQPQAGGALPGESLVLDLDGAIHYVPPTGFTGIRSWRYRVSDGSAQSDFAQIDFQISAMPVVNTAPVANPDAYLVVENVPFTRLGAGYLENDTDADGDALEWSHVYSPNGGLLPGETFTELTSGGAFTYTPPTDFTGTREFSYLATDGTVDSNYATITFTVAPRVALDEPDLPTLDGGDPDGDGSTIPTSLASTGSTSAYALGTLAALIAAAGFVLVRSSRREA